MIRFNVRRTAICIAWIGAIGAVTSVVIANAILLAVGAYLCGFGTAVDLTLVLIGKAIEMRRRRLNERPR